ncbi:MAG: hypothetical protein K2L95_01905 [Alphaproteobacteria bacterium]|nr:hypothetical protein [Alphaproteobacteria bacterium]
MNIKMVAPAVVAMALGARMAPAADICREFAVTEREMNEYIASAAGRAAEKQCNACGSGFGVVGYIDGYGNYGYHYDCGKSVSTTANFTIARQELSAPGCGGPF